MPLYVATSCVSEVADGAQALSALEAYGLERACLVPGRNPGRGWQAEAERWGDRLLLHHACLEATDKPYWNLAAGSDDWRKSSVAAAIDAMRHAANQGCKSYSLHAGYALELSLDPGGVVRGPARSREQSLDRLALSLDRLAGAADTLGLTLQIENAAGRRTPTGRSAFEPDRWSLALFQEPEEIDRVLSRVAAPMIGVLLDVAHWVISCQARRWEPVAVLEELQRWVRAIALSGTDGEQDAHRLPKMDGLEVALARQAGGLDLPLIVEVRNLPRVELLAFVRELESELTQVVGPPTVERA